MNRRDGKEVAIKVIDLEESDDDLDDIQKEISVLSRLSCPQLMLLLLLCQGSRLVHCHGIARWQVVL